MKSNYSIAIIGNKDTILGFKALGVHTYDANTPEKAVEVLYELKEKEEIIDQQSGESKPSYAIIFITEELASEISKDDYKKLSAKAMPAIIPLPGSKGSTGYGIKRIGKFVEQAVGSDIFGE